MACFRLQVSRISSIKHNHINSDEKRVTIYTLASILGSGSSAYSKMNLNLCDHKAVSSEICKIHNNIH